MKLDSLRPELRWAIEAAQDKKATGVTVLDLSELGAFTGYFVLCTGSAPRQLQAIQNAVEEQLDRHGIHPAHREGREASEWMLLDYGDMIVHIFSERARSFYDLERLWRAAKRLDIPEPGPGEPGQAAAGGR